MTPGRQRKTIAKLRCDTCRRAPTSAEQDEMVANFGPKLGDHMRPGERIVWQCLACGKAERAAVS